MKIALNQASWIGLAIFIAVSLLSIFDLIVVQTIPQAENISLAGYSALGIALLVLVVAYFLKNSFMQVGLLLGSLCGLSIWLARISIFVGIFPSIAVISLALLLFVLSFFFFEKDFFSAYRQVCLVVGFAIALTALAAVLVSYAEQFAVQYQNAFILLYGVLGYVAALIIISFFVRTPIISVGLVYAASIPVIMVCTVFSSPWFSIQAVVVIQFLTFLFILIQNQFLTRLRVRVTVSRK
jgi:hypothetical protein